MAGTALDTLGDDTALISAAIAHPGGQGVFSCKGQPPAAEGSGARFALILEDDTTGDFAPSGDAVLHYIGERITFFLPACNIRARLNGSDPSGSSPATAIEPFVSI